MIERLSVLTPDAKRSTKVIERCHDRLSRHRRRADRRKRATTLRAVVVGFAALQLIAVAATALSVFAAL